jgi:hypothetical protein
VRADSHHWKTGQEPWRIDLSVSSVQRPLLEAIRAQYNPGKMLSNEIPRCAFSPAHGKEIQARRQRPAASYHDVTS